MTAITESSMLNLRGQDILIPSHLLFTAKELFQLKQFCTLDVVQEHSLASCMSAALLGLSTTANYLFPSLLTSWIFLCQTVCMFLFYFSHHKGIDLKKVFLLCRLYFSPPLSVEPAFHSALLIPGAQFKLVGFWLLYSLHYHMCL